MRRTEPVLDLTLLTFAPLTFITKVASGPPSLVAFDFQSRLNKAEARHVYCT